MDWSSDVCSSDRGRGVHRHLQPAPAGLDADPVETDRPDGSARLVLDQRAVDRRRDIRAGTPVGRYGNLQGRALGGDGLLADEMHGVGGDGQQQLARERRLDAHPGGVPRRIRLPLDEDPGPVGPVGVVRADGPEHGRAAWRDKVWYYW